MTNLPTHPCPAAGCKQSALYGDLCCVDHWKTISRDLRNSLWRARMDHGIGGPAWWEARAKCLDALGALVEPIQPPSPTPPRHTLMSVGDTMQSEASRILDYIEKAMEDGWFHWTSYEAQMAALALEASIDNWTELRRQRPMSWGNETPS